MTQKNISGCCSFIWQWIKQLYADNVVELKELLWFVALMIPPTLLNFSPFIIVLAFSGHLGKMDLDAMTLCSSFITITGISIGQGLTTACDTLVSQIYGGKNLKLIGVIIQRAILILFLACFPCWALFVNTKSILLLLGQDPKVASLAERCVMVQIPSLPVIFYCQLQQRYLQNQGIIWPQTIICFIGNILLIILCYVFLFIVKTGVIGASVALTITYTSELILLFLFIHLKKLHVDTWPGWSFICLADWNSFLSLGIPSMLMLYTEWWIYDIAIFLAGHINLVELGAQAVLLELGIFLHEISYSVAMACSIKLGNYLGAGETDKAKKVAQLSFLVTAFTTLFLISILLGLRTPIVSLLTNDKEILSLVIKATPIIAIFFVADAMCALFGGIIRGTGKQTVGAIVYALGFLLINFSISIPLMFVVKIGTRGFWIGVTAGIFFIDIFFLIYYWRINWQDLTKQAQERAGLTKNSEKEPISFHYSGHDTSDNLELKNYAALESSNSETQLDRQVSQPSKKKIDQPLKKIIIRRVLDTIAVVSVFIIGLIIRFTVKHP
ncbi:multidrug and toxin extrusion protein 1-like isoform X2 [Bombina bombina]|uniref:multidrug and toxin extrusion protein 1-like isoform X2 n=1 Tax=Bombina bombina TaxID=8345 RepID=UPI00235B0C8A|nr:multidrug and toxin extrusion protein 1-like isoform X2 [Bombina bombina]